MKIMLTLMSALQKGISDQYVGEMGSFSRPFNDAIPNYAPFQCINSGLVPTRKFKT